MSYIITTESQVFKHKIYLVANSNGGMRCTSQGSAVAFAHLVDAQANAGTDGGVYTIRIDSPLACPQAAMLDPSFGDEVEAGAWGLGLMSPQVIQRETIAIKKAQAERELRAQNPMAEAVIDAAGDVIHIVGAMRKHPDAAVRANARALQLIAGRLLNSPAADIKPIRTTVTMTGAEYLAQLARVVA